MNQEELNRRFDYHAPNDETREVHNEIRRITKSYAAVLVGKLPPGREAALFMTALEEASFWAHAAVARYQAPSPQVF